MPAVPRRRECRSDLQCLVVGRGLLFESQSIVAGFGLAMTVRTLRRMSEGISGYCALLLGLGCGPSAGATDGDDSGSAQTTGSETTGSGTTGSTTGSDSDTDDPPIDPDCESRAECGDGVVGWGEGCDDADVDEDDECSTACRRPAPLVSAPVHDVRNPIAAVDTDGSVVVIADEGTVVFRVGSDGTELWRVPLIPPEGVDGVEVVAVLLGSEIEIVGNSAQGGVLWRMAANGGLVVSQVDPEGGRYLAADRDPAGGLVLERIDAEGEQATVVRLDPSWDETWSRVLELPDNGGVMDIAAAADDVVVAAGGIGGQGEGLILRVTPDAVTQTILSTPEYPNSYLNQVTADGHGGAVATGAAGSFPVIVRVDAQGNVAWLNACSDEYGRAQTTRVIDDRILIGGRRGNLEPGCTDACSGAHHMWVQQLSLDGTVLATDTGEAFATEGPYPFEHVLALGRLPGGPAVGVGYAEPNTVFVVQLAW